MLPDKTQRAVDLACEKGASNWLTVIPLKDMDFDLNKREFRDAVGLRYDWPIPDNPSVCVCGSMFAGRSRDGLPAWRLRACLHGVGDPGLVGLVSFVFTLWGTQKKRNLPH